VEVEANRQQSGNRLDELIVEFAGKKSPLLAFMRERYRANHAKGSLQWRI
jgi:hypothetical protein